MDKANQPFPLRNLPQEIQDMVWVQTLELEGPPQIQVVEMDLMEGCEHALFPRLERPSTPALYAPVSSLGGKGTANVSTYNTVQAAIKASKGATEAIAFKENTLRRRRPDNLVELKADRNPDFFLQSNLGPTAVWMDVGKDLLCIHGPGITASRFGPMTMDYVPNVAWFSRFSDWTRREIDFFRPLTFFNLDKFERVGIDFNAEVKRGTIMKDCEGHVCNMLRRTFLHSVYHTPAERIHPEMSQLEEIRALLAVAPFANPLWPYGLDTALDTEFECLRCRMIVPGWEGRSERMSNMPHTPEALLSLEWQPKCMDWHRPCFASDIDTLLLGRLPALKTFYVIDTKIQPKPGRQPARTAEAFSGVGCKFVEVKADDDAWDLSEYGRHNGFHSLHYAARLQDLAWKYACTKHTNELMDAEGDAGDDDDQPPVPELEGHSLAEPIFMSWTRGEALRQLQHPAMAPESVLPVVVKVLTRIDE